MSFKSPWVRNSAKTSEKNSEPPPIFFYFGNLVVACVTHRGNIQHEFAVFSTHNEKGSNWFLFDFYTETATDLKPHQSYGVSGNRKNMYPVFAHPLFK